MSMNDLKRKFLNFFHNLSFFLKRYWPFLAFFLISVTFFYLVLLQNKIPLPADALVTAHVPWTELKWEEYPAGIPVKNQEITDSFSQFYPWRSVVGEFWGEGKIPLWNPYMFSGTPFLATWHSAALYPLNILYIFFSDLNAWTNLLFLQILLSGIFMYLFLRNIKLTKAASFLGAISFSFSGYMIAWFEFATGPHAGLWLPLLLLFEFKLINTNKKIWFVPIPFILFFIYTAGDFQVPFYITLIFLSFGFFLISRKKDKFLVSIKLITSFIFGILLSLPQLLPTIELFKESVRLNDPYIKEYFYGLMHWEKIVNFIWPDFFGNVVTGNYWGKFGFHEYMGFVGVVALVFALYSIFTKRIKHEIFFVATFFLTIIFLFPFPTAFLPYLLKIPGLSTSSASRLLFIADFSLAVLASYGFNKWLKIKKSNFSKIPIILIAVTLVTVVFIVSAIVKFPEQAINLTVALKNMLPASFVLALVYIFSRYKKIGVYLLIVLAALEMFWYARKNTPFSPRDFVFPSTEILEFLQKNLGSWRFAGGIPLNLHMPYNLRSPEGYDPIYPTINAEWISLVNFGTKENLRRRYGIIHYFDSELLDYASVKYVVDYKKNMYGDPSQKGEYARGLDETRYKKVFDEGRIDVFENRNVLPRVWVTTNFSQKYEELILKPDDLKYKINNFKQLKNRFDITVELEKDGYLFLSETFYPGWIAYVDSRKEEIKKANYLFQSIKLNQGKHEVSFVYEPKSFTIGKYLLFSGLVVLFLYYFFEKARKI